MFAPTFSITNKILNHISRIEAAEEVIKHAPVLPLWEKQFQEDAMIRTVYHGTHIEGNQLDKAGAKDVLMGRDVIGRSRDIQEVINYRNVLDLVEEETNKGIDKISENLVKKLHRLIVDKILSEDQAGVYRDKQVVIKNNQTDEVTFRPPTAAEVPLLMKEFLYWLSKTDKEDMHPVLKAGIAHHELVRIHPFTDGNGRLGRALATLVLFIGGYDIRRFFSLEEFYDKDAASYYENLNKATSGDMAGWLEYFTFGAAIEFDRVKERILKLSQDARLKDKMGGKQIFLTERQAKIIEIINDNGALQNKMFDSFFPQISEDSVLRDVQDLIQKGIIKKVGSTKGARYELVA